MLSSSFLILVGPHGWRALCDGRGCASWVNVPRWYPQAKSRLFTSTFRSYNSKKAKRQERRPFESSLLLSSGIFKVTVKDSGRSGCPGTFAFPLVITLHCPVPIPVSDSQIIAAACLGTFQDELTQHSRWYLH